MTLHSKLLDEGKCVGTSRFLWDQTEFNEFSAIALNICRECPVKGLCLQWVEPKRSFYDGVAGGHIFKHGRLIL